LNRLASFHADQLLDRISRGPLPIDFRFASIIRISTSAPSPLRPRPNRDESPRSRHRRRRNFHNEIAAVTLPSAAENEIQKALPAVQARYADTTAATGPHRASQGRGPSARIPLSKAEPCRFNIHIIGDEASSLAGDVTRPCFVERHRGCFLLGIRTGKNCRMPIDWCGAVARSRSHDLDDFRRRRPALCSRNNDLPDPTTRTPTSTPWAESMS